MKLFNVLNYEEKNIKVKFALKQNLSLTKNTK